MHNSMHDIAIFCMQIGAEFCSFEARELKRGGMRGGTLKKHDEGTPAPWLPQGRRIAYAHSAPLP